MEKAISNFNISETISKGVQLQMLICPSCKHKNIITSRTKLTFTKIQTTNCNNCGKSIKTGDIFNFKTGTKLNNLNVHHNQQLLDNYIWNTEYDKI